MALFDLCLNLDCIRFQLLQKNVSKVCIFSYTFAIIPCQVGYIKTITCSDMLKNKLQEISDNKMQEIYSFVSY